MKMSSLTKLGSIAVLLGSASSAMAVGLPGGSVNISGQLGSSTVSTCTITVPATYQFPALNAKDIDTSPAWEQLGDAITGKFTFADCEGKSPWIALVNDMGDTFYLEGGTGNATKGLFNYEHKPEGATRAQEPLFYKYRTITPAAITAIALNGTGTNHIDVKSTDYSITLYHLKDNSANGYQGSYTANLTMTVNYK